MKIKTKTGIGITLYIMMLIIISNLVLGMGLVPASETILIGTDKQEFEIHIMNSDDKHYELKAEIQGDLAKYITLDKKELVLPQNKKYETIKVKINLPENHGLAPGEHTTRIIISNQGTGTGEISAKISLSFRLTVIIPYEGAYLDNTLYAPNFDKTKGGNFVIQAQNKGSDNAVNVVPIIDIYSSTNQKILTLKGDGQIVRKGETVNFAIPLSETLENGRYTAKASLVYSGIAKSDERIFTVGTPEIKIDTISASTFQLGGIAGFDIFLLNNWGEEIRGVFAEVEFRKGQEILEQTTTATVNVGAMQRARLNAYWDTTGMPTGPYNLIIKLNYLDKTDTKQQEIALETNNIRIIGTGHVVTEKETDGGTGLLILVIFIMVILNSFLIYKFVIKKKH